MATGKSGPWARAIRQQYQVTEDGALTERHDRERQTNIPAADLGRRRELWAPLSEFWLDTELQDSDLKWIASRLLQTGYAWTEIERICLHEVAPALFDNLRPPAGAWAGFDPAWLEERILTRIGRPGHDAWVARNRDKLWQFIGQDWRVVAKQFQALQISGH